MLFGEQDTNSRHGIGFNEKNSARVDRQKKAPIRVIIANPPYNAGQADENDNNKNRKYPELDRRVSATYGEDSKATLLRKLSDPYVKAIRYATDRIGESGIVCFVNNNSFVTEKTFDGMRKELAKEFDLIYVLDLGGNVRKNPKLSGTTHNVFGIQVGVSINLFIRLPTDEGREAPLPKFIITPLPGLAQGAEIRIPRKQGRNRRREMGETDPDKKGNWITNGTDEEFEAFIPIGSKEAKARARVCRPSSKLTRLAFQPIATPWCMISMRSGSSSALSNLPRTTTRTPSLAEKRQATERSMDNFVDS